MPIMSEPWLYPAGFMVLTFLFGFVLCVHRSNTRSAEAVQAWNARAEALRTPAAPAVYTYRADLRTISTMPGRVSGHIRALRPGVEPTEAVLADWSTLSVFTLDYMQEAVRHVLLFVEEVHLRTVAAISPTPTCQIEWVLDDGPTRLIPPAAATRVTATVMS